MPVGGSGRTYRMVSMTTQQAALGDYGVVRPKALCTGRRQGCIRYGTAAAKAYCGLTARGALDDDVWATFAYAYQSIWATAGPLEIVGGYLTLRREPVGESGVHQGGL